MKRDANPEKGLEALDQCEYMVLAMTDGEGKPYCIPLNGVRVGENKRKTVQIDVVILDRELFEEYAGYILKNFQYSVVINIVSS